MALSRIVPTAAGTAPEKVGNTPEPKTETHKKIDRS